MDMENISELLEANIIYGVIALVVVTVVIMLLVLIKSFSKTPRSSSKGGIKEKVSLVLKQASVAIPQAADYPGMLGKEGAMLINHIQQHLSYIRESAGLSFEESECKKSTAEMTSVEFQHVLVDCQNKLKQLSKLLVEASKKASDINLPKAHKEIRTIKSLGEVGLIDEKDGINII